jgi:hypothetical protein
VPADTDASLDATPAAAPGHVVVPARTHRVRAWLLLAFAAWNVWVWTTRVFNLAEEAGQWSAAFVAVHMVLFGTGLIGAAIFAVIGVRMLREARRATRLHP